MTTEFSSELSAFAPTPGGTYGGGVRLDFKRLVRMRWRLMLGVLTACAVPLLTLSWFTIPLEYQARAIIEFSEPVDVLESDTGRFSRQAYEQWVLTQAQLIESSPILKLVLEDPEIRNLPLVAGSSDKLKTLEDKADAIYTRGTQLVRVTCRDEDSNTAHTIVAVVVREYMDYATTQMVGLDENKMQILLDKEDEMKKNLGILRDTIKARIENSGAALAEGGASARAEADQYRQAQVTAQTELVARQAESQQQADLVREIEALQARHQASPDDPIYEHGIEDRMASTASVGVLEQNLAVKESEVALLRDRHLEGSKQLVVAEQSLAAAEQNLAQAKRRAREEHINSLLSQFRQTHKEAQVDEAMIQAQVDGFDEQIRLAEARLEDVSAAVAEIDDLKQRAALLESRLVTYTDRLDVLDTQHRAPHSITLASPVAVTATPEWGRRLQFMLVALVLSCCLSLSAGVIREWSDQEMRTPRDVARATDLPTIGVIPDVIMDRLPPDCNPALVCDEYPDCTSADEYRRILTRIIYPQEGVGELRTVVITSSSRDDGKTAVASNLAIALAQAGRRVLLVDISARRPDIERVFGLAPGAGLSEILQGDASPSKVIRATRCRNLSVLGPGLDTEGLIGRLASNDTIEFFEQAEKAFQHVIIDTPPALLMADAKLLAPVVDGVILVVGDKASTIGKVRRFVEEMREVGANTIGVVLNRAKQMPGGYMASNLESFYAYAEGPGTGKSRRPTKHINRGPDPEPADRAGDDTGDQFSAASDREPGQESVWEPEEDKPSSSEEVPEHTIILLDEEDEDDAHRGDDNGE